MVSFATIDGATTKGSKYAPLALRQMVGDQRAARDLATGGTAMATLTIDINLDANQATEEMQILQVGTTLASIGASDFIV